jgi:hypothetical protein
MADFGSHEEPCKDVGEGRTLLFPKNKSWRENVIQLLLLMEIEYIAIFTTAVIRRGRAGSLRLVNVIVCGDK